MSCEAMPADLSAVHMESSKKNAENCPSSVNQAHADVLVTDSQASPAPPAAFAGPPFARRKGRSFGASVIAHLGPGQASQLVSSSKSPIYTQQKPFMHVAVPVPMAPQVKAAPAVLALAEHHAPMAHQPSPTVTSRQSHGAAMIASMTSKNSPRPGTPSQANVTPAVSTHAQTLLANTTSGDTAPVRSKSGSSPREKANPTNAASFDADDHAVGAEAVQAPPRIPRCQTSESAPKGDVPPQTSCHPTCNVDVLACEPDSAPTPVAMAPDAIRDEPVQLHVPSAYSSPTASVPAEAGNRKQSPGVPQ